MKITARIGDIEVTYEDSGLNPVSRSEPSTNNMEVLFGTIVKICSEAEGLYITKCVEDKS